MNTYEYLPQLIVAYDNDNEFANLIHVKSADKNINYRCPVCGGIVKPRAINSNKEQSHYFHKTGKCTKEKQLEFFCKNWLFKEGSKFYINENLFIVDHIEIKKEHSTPFGNYIPDITVYTTLNEEIYFEMFFSSIKTGDNYFCKWDYLKNDVVEINIKEYMYKTNKNDIPKFKYLYHNGECFSKEYKQRDLYANIIAKEIHKLTREESVNFKIRIEKLDWFWQKIINGETKEDLLNIISEMNYEDMCLCYSIIKRKQCVCYLKNDVLNLINDKILKEIRAKIGLPEDKNIYFDLKYIRGRTYEAGIILNIKTKHITYNDIYFHCDYHNVYKFENLNDYPKIVFKKNIHTIDEIEIPSKRIKELFDIYNKTVDFKNEIINNIEIELDNLEKDGFKVKMINNKYTVLYKINNDNFEVILENYYMKNFDKNKLLNEINMKIEEIKCKEFINFILESNEYKLFNEYLCDIKDIKINISIDYDNYNRFICFKLYINNNIYYNQHLEKDYNYFIEKVYEYKKIINDYIDKHSIIINIVKKINSCKNKFWKAEIFSDYYGSGIKIDQNIFKPYFTTFKKIYFEDLYNGIKSSGENDIIKCVKDAMYSIFDNMAKNKYYVLGVW